MAVERESELAAASKPAMAKSEAAEYSDNLIVIIILNQLTRSNQKLYNKPRKYIISNN